MKQKPMKTLQTVNKNEGQICCKTEMKLSFNLCRNIESRMFTFLGAGTETQPYETLYSHSSQLEKSIVWHEFRFY